MSDLNNIRASLVVIALLLPDLKTRNDLFLPQNETSFKHIKIERGKCYQVAVHVFT